MSSLESYFGAVPDPRAGNATHRLGDLIVMMIAALLREQRELRRVARSAQARS
ncbi:ISAs1 family transposase, partial [Mesorhizobium sp. M1C.F.Ca.ET.187.01.1.1]